MIRPLADRVVLEPKEAETKTAAGLYIPDTAKEKPQQGKVVACGPGKKDEPMGVKVGDEVLYILSSVSQTLWLFCKFNFRRLLLWQKISNSTLTFAQK